MEAQSGNWDDFLFRRNHTIVDTFCGVDGDLRLEALIAFKSGEFLPICLAEIFLVSIPHAIFLLAGWIRIIQLYDEPKYVTGLGKGFFRNRHVPLSMKVTTVVKFFAVFLSAVVLNFSNLVSLIFQESQIATVVIFANTIKFLSWVMCGAILIMEFSRNRPHWFGVRLFWTVAMFSAVVELIQIIPEIFNSKFNFYDLRSILHLIVIMSNTVLFLLGLLGVCAKSFLEVFRDPARDEFMEQTKVDRARIRYRDLFQIVRYGWYLFIPGMILAIGQGTSVIQIAEASAHFIDRAKEVHTPGFDNDGFHVLKSNLYLIAMWIAIGTVCTMGQMTLFGLGGEVTLNKLRNKLFGSLCFQDLGFFSNIGTGYLLSRLTTDIDIVGLALTTQLSAFLPPLVEMIVGIVSLLRSSTKLCLLMIGLLLITLVVTTVRSRLITRRYSVFYSDAKAMAAKIAAEVIQGFQVVRTFGKDFEEKKKYNSKTRKIMKIGGTKEFLEAISEGIEFFLNNAIICVGLYYGMTLVIASYMEPKELIQFVLVGINTIRAFLAMIKVLPELYNAAGPAARVFQLTNRLPDVNIDHGLEIPDAEFKGAIEFRNVTFAYPSGDVDEDGKKQNVLTNFNLEIPAGKTVALVGASGSGKSTVLSLCMRFFDIDEGNGHIVVDGRDIRTIKPRWLMKQIGLVSQFAFLFDTTIEENVKYSCMKPEDFEDEMAFWNAIEMANAQNVIEGHTSREQFGVGEGGNNLSGGQKQRVSIARCIRKNPRMIFLDEVTSALDPESEQQVMDGLTNLSSGKTTLIVAHRLHTVINADKIVVMNRGQIVEEGTHQELMDLDGMYRSLFMKQQVLNKEAASVMDDGHEQDVGYNKEEEKLLMERLVETLETHNCFQNEEIQSMVQRLVKKDHERRRRRRTVLRTVDDVELEDRGDRKSVV